MTGVDVALLWNLDVFVLSTLFGIGGLLRVMIGKMSGYMVIGVTMAAHLVNCVGLLAYYLH